MEVQLGDKIWLHYGPNVLIVGHLVDHSPNHEMIGLSPVPFDEYKKLSTSEKASCPMQWCELKSCHYLCHTSGADMRKQDEKAVPKAGFFNM